MKNNIDKIITLDDGTKYMILDQGNYNNKAYYMTSKLDNEDNLTEVFSIMEETINNSVATVSTVKDEKLLKALAEYFKERVSI